MKIAVSLYTDKDQSTKTKDQIQRIMSTTEAACYSTPEEAGLRVETLPFERIPHQSRLFLDYLRDPLALSRFYPSAVRFHHELAARAPEVLPSYKTARPASLNAVERMSW